MYHNGLCSGIAFVFVFDISIDYCQSVVRQINHLVVDDIRCFYQVCQYWVFLYLNMCKAYVGFVLSSGMDVLILWYLYCM